jgi:hypothetical protein
MTFPEEADNIDIKEFIVSLVIRYFGNRGQPPT